MAICTSCGQQYTDGTICPCRYSSQQQPQNQYAQQPQQYAQQPQQYAQQPQQQYSQPQQYAQQPQQQYAQQPQQRPPQYGQQPPNPYGQQPQRPPQYGQPPNPYGQQPMSPYGPYPGQPLQGKTMIRVAGIILTIFAAISVIYDIIILASPLSYFIDTMNYISMFMGLVMLAAGIIATAFAPKKDKAMLVMIFGIVLIFWQLISLIVTLTSPMYLFGGVQIILKLLGFVLPILLTIGGFKRKNAPF